MSVLIVESGNELGLLPDNSVYKPIQIRFYFCHFYILTDDEKIQIIDFIIEFL